MGVRLRVSATLDAIKTSSGSIVTTMGRQLGTSLSVSILGGIGVRLVLGTVGRSAVSGGRGAVLVSAASVAAVLRCHRAGRVRSVGNGLVVVGRGCRGLCRSGSVRSIAVAG